MSRLDKDQYFLKIAQVVALRSTCIRRQYGAVIVSTRGTIISTGYNGAPVGEPNCCDVGYCWREENNIPHGQRYEKCLSGDTTIKLLNGKYMTIAEMAKSPERDGHTSQQAIQRIASLQKPDSATVLTYYDALEQSLHEGAVWFESPATETSFYARVYENISSNDKVVIRTFDSTVFIGNKDDYKKTWVCFNRKPMYDESYNFWRSER